MTHNELLVILMDKMPNLNVFDIDILKDIVAGIALKENSLYDFYRELMTSGEYLDIALVKKIAEKYSVPRLYKKHIDDRFAKFKENIKIVCIENTKALNNGKRPGLNPDRWLRDKKPMFGSTEKITIEKAGGLESVCKNMMHVGHFDYLRTLFEESATDVSKVKYALIMSKHKELEHKK